MATVANVLTACPTLQTRLNDVWGQGNCVGADDRKAHLQFLLSQENQRPVSMLLVPGGGKKRTVQVKYDQRLLESTLTTNQPNPNCGVGVKPEDSQVSYVIDTDANIQTQGFELTAQDLEAVCDPNSEIFTRQMLKQMDVLSRGVATEAATQSVALAGSWGNGLFGTGTGVGQVSTQTAGAKLSVKTLTTVAANTINILDAHPVIWNALEDIGACNMPFIVGGTTLQKYYQASRHGCCADQGIDLSGIYAEFGYAFARDRRISTALASEDEAMILIPGAQQLVQYTRSPWKDGMGIPIGGSNYIHQVVMHPGTGELYDWTLNDNCGTVTSNLTWTGMVIGMPDDMFAVGDVYEKYNGASKVRVNNV